MKHTELDVWKVSMEMVETIYRYTRRFPKEEVYGLSSQLRRAAISIPSNIAEGSARQTSKSYLQFLYCAQGSMAEVETQVALARRLGYLQIEDEAIVDELRARVGKMLYRLIRKIKTRDDWTT